MINRIGYNLKSFFLVTDTGKDAHINTTYKDFRGAPHVLKDARAPHKPGSTGRVITNKGEFFPSVIGLTWIES